MNLKQISLSRTDDEAEDINISLGEVIIGRGQLLGCTDKKVSRNHGLIKLSEEGDVILISKHENPIYYTEAGKPSIALKPDQSVILRDGDRFSLLLDTYNFQVSIAPDIKTEPEQKYHVNGINTDKEDISNEVNHKASVKDKSYEEMEDQLNGDMADVPDFSSSIRELPSWMTNPSEVTSKPGPSKHVNNARKRKEENDTEKTDKRKRATPRKRKKADADDCSDEDINEDPVPSKSPQKNRKTVVREETDDVDKRDTSNNVESRTKPHDLSEDEEEDDTATPKIPALDNVKPAEEEQSDNSKEDEADGDKTDDQSDNTTATGGGGDAAGNKRQKCLYAAGCYRKNPQHRIDFSHPGDVDYDDDDIPECPYGTTCYRKNKQHRLDYKHTAPPQQANKKQKSPKKQKKRPRPTYNDDDEEDDYDFDDPFLNDASSDDYQPTDSGSDTAVSTDDDGEEDDARRMIKEAKRFTRKKK